MSLNSRVIIAKNIKMDKDYKNVLNYSNDNMVELLLSTDHFVAQNSTYQFLNVVDRKIRVSFNYNDVLSANYIAFQNPYYANKWFFAWIDSVEFKSDNCSEITYTVDAWSTWYGYWEQKPCYIIREHVNDDTVGNHTVPEGLELGDYVLNARVENFKSDPTEYVICMGVTELPNESTPYNNNRVYNSIYGGLYYLGFANANNCTNAIKIYDGLGKSDAIISLFMIPNSIESYTDGTAVVWTGTKGGTTITSNLKYLASSDISDTIGTINIEEPTKIGNNYTPKNKKLFTYPYNFFNVTNNSGITETFKYEDFAYDSVLGKKSIALRVESSLTPGMSIKAIPLFYKNENINYNFGIVGGKLPVCSYNSDVYQNWLRQNGLNTVFNLIGGGISVAGGVGSGSVSGALSGISSMYNALHQVTLADMTPNQAKGNTNAGDINFSYENCGLFSIYKMSIKDEYAKIIDDYFSRYGYRINEVKLANITGRSIFNYIEIGQGECIGYSSGSTSIPGEYMDIINNACRAGVTIWHNHANIGNYLLDNNII